MKRSELIFNISSIFVDIASLFVAGLVSFYLRLRLASHVPIIFSLDLRGFMKFLLPSIALLLVYFGFAGLYNLRATRKFSSELYKIFMAISYGLMTVIIIFFFDQQAFQSRLIVLTTWFLAIVFVAIGRYILRAFQVMYLANGYGLHKLLVINGTQEVTGFSIIKEITENPELGYKVVAELFGNSGDLLAQVEEIYRNESIEEILQANPDLPQETNLALVQFARNHGLTFNFVPNMFDVQRNVIEIETVKGMPYIALKNTPLDGWGKVVKRIFDVILASLCLIVTSPIILAIAIAIKIDSHGSVLYIAPRVGWGADNEFKFYKFRTMYAHLSVGDGYGGEDAQRLREELWRENVRGGADGAIPKFRNDPRVTRLGRFLRRTKLDEIPQFWNVLKGDMSMVGPRAHLNDEVMRYRNKYRRTFTIKPGIFGLAQLAQMDAPDLKFEEEMRLNTYYIDNWSIWLDIGILIRSFYYLFFVKKSKDIY